MDDDGRDEQPDDLPECDEDDARADDFRCVGCETPLPYWRRRGEFCATCAGERP